MCLHTVLYRKFKCKSESILLEPLVFQKRGSDRTCSISVTNLGDGELNYKWRVESDSAKNWTICLSKKSLKTWRYKRFCKNLHNFGIVWRCFPETCCSHAIYWVNDYVQEVSWEVSDEIWKEANFPVITVEIRGQFLDQELPFDYIWVKYKEPISDEIFDNLLIVVVGLINVKVEYTI